MALAVLALSGPAARAQTLPAMKFVTSPLITANNAVAHFGSSTTHTNSLAGVSGFGATAPEIVETARALKNNPDQIFDFVHNQIETEFSFGERKGALGALIDKSGTPFDQNVLFVSLARQAGYTAQYEIGQITITQADFKRWTGVSDLGAVCRLLSSGGIPLHFNPTQPPSNCQASGDFTSVTILHIWSQVCIGGTGQACTGGTWYAYDPSFKTYATNQIPVTLLSAAGISPGDAAFAAGIGMDSGSPGGVPYIQNVGAGSLDSYLTARGTQLLGSLKANNPDWDIDQVAGITKIQAAYAPAGGWRNPTPPGYTVTGTPITITGDIPDQYRTKFQVQLSVATDQIHYVSALNWTFYVDDIDGRRIGLATNFNDVGRPLNPAAYFNGSSISPENYTTGEVDLQVDDVTVQPWSCVIDFYTCFGGQSPGQVTLTATHPYAAGTFADETVVKQLTATAAPVAIISGWGMVSPARLAKWGDEVANDTALPYGNIPPWPCGGEGELCYPSYPIASSGDLTRQKLAASWLAQMTRMMQLQATIAGAKVEHHHSIGVADWRHTVTGYLQPPPVPPVTSGPDFFSIADEFSDLNVDTVASVSPVASSANSVAALSRSIALASATQEGSVLEQMEDLPDTASTASRFAWGNNPGADNSPSDPEDPCYTGNNPRRFFDYTNTLSTTRTGLYQFEGITAPTPYCTAPPLQYGSWATTFVNQAESAISGYLAQGFKVTSSAETFLGPGARFGPCYGKPPNTLCAASQQRGTALVATLFDGSGNVTQVAHVLTSVSGVSKGGGGKQPESFTAYDPAKAGDVLKDRFVDRSVALGVDLKTGTAGYNTPTLVSVGTGAAPYKLDYSLNFKAAPTGCNIFGPCTNPIQGGWNQSWDVRFVNSGSGQEALGATSPFAAAGTLAAFLVMQDIFGQSGLANLNQDTFAALAADWWRAQMVANVATLSRGFSGQQYVRLVDGTWMAPVGAPGVLTQTGTRVKVRPGCHSFGSGWNELTSRRWDISGVSFSLRNAGGDVIAFAPWLWLYDPGADDNCAQVSGYEPTSWTWPQGVSLTFAYGTPIGGSQIDYSTGVTGITTSLGRSMTFTSGLAAPSPFSATANGITVGQQTTGTGPYIADAQAAPGGGNTGKFWNFTYTAPLARTASQRPIPYPQLSQVFEPVSATLPALQYTYDTRGLVEAAFDADELQLPASAGFPPYIWYLATGGRGERDDPLGGAYTVYYDTDGNPARNIDEIGRETDSLWDGRHRVVSRAFPESEPETFPTPHQYDLEQFTYDANDNVLSLTKVAKLCSPTPCTQLPNIVVQAAYETSWNHLASITDAMGKTTNFTYYPNSGVCGTMGAASSMMCEAQRPTVNGSRPTYTFQYATTGTALGLVNQSVDAAGITTKHAYDSYGNLTSTTEGAAAVGGNPALNLTTTFTPDAVGNVTATTTPLGYVSNATFDYDRRKLLEIDPDPGGGGRTATNTVYDANGRAVEVDKGTWSGTTFTPLETATITFDPNGNKALVSMLNGPLGSATLSVTQTSYDPLNRVICTAERENAAVFASLPDACTQSAGGAAGPDHITRIGYDVAGQKLTETRGLGTPIQSLYGTWTWGGDGEVLTILDANNNLTTNTWDGFNRLYEVSYPMPTLGAGASNPSDIEAYHCLESGVPTSYDANGNLLCKTKRDGTTVIQYRYDVLNRRTLKLFVGGSINNVSYGYDPAGRPLNALYENQTGTPGVTWSYDAAGRRITEATNGLGLAFTYDNDGNPKKLTWPDGNVANYVYDTADRFVSVGNANAGTVSASYDTLSRVNGLTRASSSSTLGYDPADRLTSLAHAFTPTTGNEAWTLGFTAGGQLASSVSSNAAWDWQPAAASPVTTAPNGLNQNASVGGTAWTYDKNGNLTSDGVRTFTYDAENRLLTESGPITMTLSYDPTGRLQQSVIGSTTTQFLWDGDALVQEFDGAGNRLRRYFHGPQVDDPLIWLEGAGIGSATVHYLIADRQGSIAGNANSSGAITKNYTYDPYGVPGAWGTIGTDPRFRYTGQAAIPEAQLYYYKARVYDPAAGKFLQTDPVGDESDLNLYGYVHEDPLNSADPTGDADACTGTNIGGVSCAESASPVASFGVVKQGSTQNGPGSLPPGSSSSRTPAGGVSNTTVAPGQSGKTSGKRPDGMQAELTNTRLAQIFLGQVPPEILPEEIPEEITPPEVVTPEATVPRPSVPYPKDPNVPPGAGWEWRGPVNKGQWYNPKTGESLRPDLSHPKPIGPHWDYSPGRGSGGRGGYRWFPDGRITPKAAPPSNPGLIA